MSALSLFNFNGHDVRVAMLDGTHWWVAVDVCRALGMELYSGTTQWLRGLRSDERKRVGRSDLPEIFSGTSAGSMTIITESGLSALAKRIPGP